MFYWIPYAFVRIVVVFILGIAGALFTPIVSETPAAVIFLALVALFFILVIINHRKKKVLINPGLTGLFAIFFAGYLCLLFHTETRRDDHLVHVGRIDAFCAVAAGAADEKPNTWKQVVSVTKVRENGAWRNASGKVMLYYPRAVYQEGFRYGDVLLIKGNPSLVPAPPNPGEFDHRRFLSWKNVYHQFFSRGEMAVTGYEPPSALIAFTHRLRAMAYAVLARNIKGREELAIASALVLGITDGLDNDVTRAYAATGSMHVLAVSGLHVGIIYLILRFVLRPVGKSKYGKWITALASIVALWCYACVTGLSPSVLRAVTMFSFVALAVPLNHRTNIYNTLGVSAFFLLLFNPFLVMSVGFQLSYVAVTAIVYLQPLLYNLFEPDSRFIDEIWKISSVSVAAQIGTFALGLLYFHQFPNYFLISNLFVIPLAFVILTGGLAVIATGAAPVLSEGIGYLVEWVIRLLNFLIRRVEAIPFSVTDDVVVTPLQCALLILAIVCITVFIQFKKIAGFYGAALALTLFSFLSWQHYTRNFCTSKFTVYKISGHSAYDLIANGNVWYFGDSLWHSDPARVNFSVRPNRMHAFAPDVYNGNNASFSKEVSTGRITIWQGKTILQLYAIPESLPEAFRTDFLILSQNAAANINVLLEKINATTVILDTSNSYFVADKALNSLPQHYHVHSVWHHGAFDITL
jgi:competence protein ComEC